uniref:DUF5824 domain-containing protein n=1 Tax=viral metagenome TaxID=1070528 RepID=A0A6C0DQC6_9ZZZZ
MKKTRKLKFWPEKYYRGLTRKQKLKRKKEIEKFGAKDWKDPKAYTGFRTNTLGTSKPSNYTKQWKRLFPHATSLLQKSKATGVPLRFIQECYNRGMAAWRTGHRPFATQQQWGYARVHSFLLCGKTYKTTDSDLAREAKESSVSAKRWWNRMCRS